MNFLRKKCIQIDSYTHRWLQDVNREKKNADVEERQ